MILRPLVLLLLVLSLGACSNRNRAADQLAKDSAAAKQFDGSLTFKDVTLQQFDEKGRLLWKVKAKQAQYSEDQKIAKIQTPAGELFQDGKLVFRITALRGEVQQDGQRIFLKDQIVATDIRDGVVLRGKELEWLPKQDTLIVRQNLTGSHPQVQASAQEARAYSRARRLELIGRVTATTKDPALRLQTDRLTWQMAKHLIVSDRPIQIDRLVKQAVTDRAASQKAEVNLKTKTATLKEQAKLALTTPPLNIASDALIWNLEAQTVASSQPITVLHREQQIQLSGDRGQLDLQPRIFYLVGNVRAISQSQSRLNAASLTWNIPTQAVLAEGNVSYQQPDPPINLSGPRAVGKLQDQTIVMNGGRVVTEIVP